MANNYAGYLLKINGKTFKNEWIRHSTYKSRPMQRTDSDSYVDGNGMLHRKILPHKRTSISFNIVRCSLDEKIEIQRYFADRDTVEIEYWNDESNTYETATFYTPDIEFTVYGVNDADIIYAETPIEFIEY